MKALADGCKRFTDIAPVLFYRRTLILLLAKKLPDVSILHMASAPLYTETSTAVAAWIKMECAETAVSMLMEYKEALVRDLLLLSCWPHYIPPKV